MNPEEEEIILLFFGLLGPMTGHILSVQLS
jgi:hypothetical protein